MVSKNIDVKNWSETRGLQLFCCLYSDSVVQMVILLGLESARRNSRHSTSTSPAREMSRGF